MPPYDWASNDGPTDVFLGMVSMVLVPWEFVLFQGVGMEFKSKIMLHYSRGVNRQQGFIPVAGFYVYIVIA